MAKKNYVNLSYVYDAKIEYIDNKNMQMIISGKNANGTQMRITAKVPQYFMEYMHNNMVKVADRTLQRANDIRESLNG